VVALQQGKHYIGIDLNTTYCDMAAKRIQDIEQKYA
jgi:DNA modification methylase